jgi:hypothetical protein
MLVKAIARGNYLYDREPGDVFDVPDALYSPAWMAKVGPATPVTPPKPVVMLTVKATATGQYIGIRHPGEIFSIPESLFEKSWMVKSDPAPAPPMTIEQRIARLEAKVFPPAAPITGIAAAPTSTAPAPAPALVVSSPSSPVAPLGTPFP